MANPGDINLGMAPQTPQVRSAEGGTQAAIRYVDRPEVQETFADSVTNVYFDGQSLRVEFGVTRLDEIKPNAPISGRRYPAVRLALTPMAAVDLINRMQQVAAALTQAGVLKPNAAPGAKS